MHTSPKCQKLYISHKRKKNVSYQNSFGLGQNQKRWPTVPSADLLFGQIDRALGNKYWPLVTNLPEHFRLSTMPNTTVQYLHFVDRSGMYFVVFVKFGVFSCFLCVSRVWICVWSTPTASATME